MFVHLIRDQAEPHYELRSPESEPESHVTKLRNLRHFGFIRPLIIIEDYGFLINHQG